MTKGSRERLHKDPSHVVREREVKIETLSGYPFKDIPFYALALVFSLNALYKESGVFELPSFKKRFTHTVSTPEGLRGMKEQAWEVFDRHGNPLPLYLLSFALEKESFKELSRKVVLYERKGILTHVLLDALSLARNHIRKTFKRKLP